jgi:hypothetical protein
MRLLLILLACAAEPDPCPEMCRAGAALYGGCLEGWGLDWSAAGYEDEEDFLEVCETWSWEMRLLEEAAGAAGSVDATCEQRADLFNGGECEDFTGVDWGAFTWELDSGEP